MTTLGHQLAAAGGAASGLVLIAAGSVKVRHPRTFASQIAAYELVPDTIARVLGILLPVGEVAAGFTVFARPRLGGVAAAALFLAFTVAVALNLLRGRRDLVCGCFGPRGRQTITAWHVVGTLIFLILSVAASLANTRPGLAETVIGVSLPLAVAVMASVRQAWRPASELVPYKET